MLSDCRDITPCQTSIFWFFFNPSSVQPLSCPSPLLLLNVLVYRLKRFLFSAYFIFCLFIDYTHQTLPFTSVLWIWIQNFFLVGRIRNVFKGTYDPDPQQVLYKSILDVTYGTVYSVRYSKVIKFVGNILGFGSRITR